MKKSMTRKEKVLKTALQMVATGGFQGAPISELAAKSKVAVGTIYHHFANKDEMVGAMYLMCKENLVGALTVALDGKATATKRLEKILYPESMSSNWRPKIMRTKPLSALFPKWCPGRYASFTTARRATLIRSR